MAFPHTSYNKFVKFAVAGPDYLAILVDNDYEKESALNIYGESGELVYSEVYDFNAAAIAALPGEDGETLLVGGTDEVWEISLRPDETGDQVKDDIEMVSVGEGADE